MTEEEINKSNAVIALFMGGKFNDGEGVTDNTWTFEDNWYYEPLGYHASWNSLMPVIKKIKDIRNINLEYTIGIDHAITSVDVKKAYQAVVEFLELYERKKDITMSVYRTDYIVYGYKLPYSKGLTEEGTVSNEYWDGEHMPWKLIIDDMAGRYIVFGKILYSKDCYANEANDSFMEFEEIDFDSLNREELHEHYFKVFGKYPEIERKMFAFSHIY